MARYFVWLTILSMATTWQSAAKVEAGTFDGAEQNAEPATLQNPEPAPQTPAESAPQSSSESASASELISKKKEQQDAEFDRQLVLVEYLLTLGKGAAALKVVEGLKATDPEAVHTVQILKYRSLVAKGDLEQSDQLGDEIAESSKNDPEKLQRFAVAIRDHVRNRPDLDLAERLASRLNEITLEEDPDAWALLATIYSRQGQHDQALAALAKVEMLIKDDEDARQQLQFDRLVVLLQKADAPAAAALARQVFEVLKDDAESLLETAGQLIEEKIPGSQALKIADTFLRRAQEMADDAATKDALRLLQLRLSLRKKDVPAARLLADEWLDAAKEDPELLVQLVSTLLDAHHPTAEELALAKRVTIRANEKADGKDALILALLSRVYVEEGSLDRAIRMQKQAVGKAGDKETKRQLQSNLDVLNEVDTAIKGTGK